MTFELQYKLLPAGSFYDDIIKRYHVILVLFLIEGNLKRFVVYHILPPNFHTGNPNGI